MSLQALGNNSKSKSKPEVEFKSQHSFYDFVPSAEFGHPNHNSRPRQLVRKTVSAKAGLGITDEETGYVPDLPPRLVHRDRAFFQSSNKLRVQHNQGNKIMKLLKHNWFHSFLRWPTRHSLGLLMAFWTSVIFFFALLYVWYDHSNSLGDCRLGEDADTPISFAGAFAFSLETCTTVGKFGSVPFG